LNLKKQARGLIGLSNSSCNRGAFICVALVQYSMNAGILKFKAKGKAGVTKELTQMHNMNVFRPIEVEARTYNK